MLQMVAFTMAVAWPKTVAESSRYHATSRYVDVVKFLHEIEDLGAPIKLRWIGQSKEGRPIPQVIVSDPPVANAAEARRQGKLVIYIQANIHAGEVEGKEAALAILRRIGQAKVAGESLWLKDLVLIVNPIYNADGNEKWGPVAVNRPEQDGPDIVGLRPNGQGLDLNRDCVKAESPEMRAALESVYDKWDPDAVLDLHTTDGTRHGYELTYSPPLNPNTDDTIRAYAQDELLPEVREETRKKYGYDLFDYGNGIGRKDTYRWETFGYEGRCVTNYAGLRNSIGILSEATTFIPFKARIDATDRFVSMILDHFAKDKSRILKFRAEAGTPKELGVKFAMAQGRTEPVILEKLGLGEQQPLTGRPRVTQLITMPVFDRFKSTQTAEVPKSYVVPPDQFEVIRLLRRHGLKFETIHAPRTQEVSQFEVSQIKKAAQPFQGHRLITVTGAYRKVTTTLKEGMVIVPTDQPLGRLAFHLLEPEGDDGALSWGFVSGVTVGNYPILKL